MRRAFLLLKPAWLCTALCLLAPAVTSAGSGGERSLLADYRMTAWTGGDGITLGPVRSIAQDDSGYIWLASDAGLVRFDGFTFSTTDFLDAATRLPQASARAVYVARDKSLWVGYANGAGLYRLGRDTVTAVYLRGRPYGVIGAIAEGRNGTIWIGCDDGLYKFERGTWEHVPLPSTGADHRVFAIYEDRRGTLWVGGGFGLYSRREHGAFIKDPDSSDPVRSIIEDKQGVVWLADQQRGFRRAGSEPNHLFDARGQALVQDRDGYLWVGSFGDGIWRVHTSALSAPGAVAHATVENGLLNDEFATLLEDRDGNMWAGTRTGLHLFTRHKVLALTGLGIVRDVAVPANGDAWAGSSAGLVVVRHVTPSSAGTRHVVSDTPVRAVHASATGTVWAATAAGLSKVVGDRLATPVGSAATLRAITSIASDRNSLWICDDQRGLVHLTGRTLDTATIVPLGDEHPTLVSLDHDGRAWVALRSGRIIIVSDGRVEHIGPEHGRPRSPINTIVHDASGSTFVGGDAGLSVFRDGQFHTVTSRQGLPAVPVLALLADDASDLWVAFRDVGVVHIKRADFERATREESFHVPVSHIYSTSDGTAGPPFDSHAASVAPDGSLWFVTRRGVTIIDPHSAAVTRPAPLADVRVEELVTGDGRAYHAAGSALAPGTNRIRINYGSISPAAFDLPRFRYRLDGVDAGWIDAGGRRQAIYTNLVPGTYRFRVQAAEGPGAWPDDAADWSFSIEPKFYQARWFYGASALACVAFVVSGWRLRSRALRRKVEAVYAERLRISREIHDTLLQSLVGTTLQLDAAFHEVPEQQSRTRGALLAMRRQIEDYIVEARRSIWELRSPALETHDLVTAMRAAGERLTRGKVTFALTVSGVARRCPSKVETQALRIGEEAIINAVRHGSITRVEIALTFADDCLRLRVSDDGVGFDSTTAQSFSLKGHYGIATMRERAFEAGGHLLVDSAPGSGTEITAEFPLVA